MSQRWGKEERERARLAVFFGLLIVGLLLLIRAYDGDLGNLLIVWSGSRVSLVAKDAHALIRLGSTQRDYEEAKKAVEIRDDIGYQEMIAKGRAILVHQGVKALVLERDWLMVRVRVLDGEQAGQAGWLPLSCTIEAK